MDQRSTCFEKWQQRLFGVAHNRTEVCSNIIDDVYDWSSDVMSDKWNSRGARKKLRQIPEELACDVLLDQNIFAGVGNIIKNEVLFRIRLHPENKIDNIPVVKLNELIKEARKYSFDFLDWKKKFELH